LGNKLIFQQDENEKTIKDLKSTLVLEGEKMQTIEKKMQGMLIIKTVLYV